MSVRQIPSAPPASVAPLAAAVNAVLFVLALMPNALPAKPISRDVIVNTAPSANQAGLPSLTTPCLACTGNLGRNQFLGPGQFYADMTLGKTFKITEGTHLKFEWQAFNVFNRANFLLADR